MARTRIEGFAPLEDHAQEFRMAAAVDAPSGFGKTHFALTAPEPIYLAYFDPNTERVVKKVQRALEAQGKRPRRVLLRKFILPRPALAVVSTARTERVKDDAVQDAATESWNAFVDMAQAFLDAKLTEGTLVVDTASELRMLQMLAEFGKTIQIPQHLYTKPNLAYQNLFNSLRDGTGMNLLLLHRVKDKYVNDQKVEGEWVRDGYNKTSFLVDVELKLLKEQAEHDHLDEEEQVASRFGLEVIKSTERPALEGASWWGRTRRGTSRTDWTWVGTKVFPDSAVEDWR